jgi:hypothetical protein
MAQFTFKVEGLEKLKARIKALPKDVQEEVVGEIQAWGSEVNNAQLANISQQNIQDLGALQQNTKAVYNTEGVELISNVYYAPFIEFGTGAKVKVPAELNDYAIQFKGQKRGDYYDFLNNILDWVKRKGIAARYSVKTRKALNSKADKERLIETAQRIADSILRNGIKPRPYFFDPYLKKRRSLLVRIAKVISKI